MKNAIRTLTPVLALALALAAPIGAAAQPGGWTVDTVVGPLPIPTVTVVGAGPTCQEAQDNALAQLTEDYFLLGVSYGPCLCSDVVDPFTGNYVTTLCSVKATAQAFWKIIRLGD